MYDATLFDQLIEAGYKRHDGHLYKGEYCVAVYQKTFFDDDGKKAFFVNVYEWRLPEQIANLGYRLQIEMEVDLFVSEEICPTMPEDRRVRTSCSLRNWANPESIEKMVWEMYRRLGCGPDANNN